VYALIRLEVALVAGALGLAGVAGVAWQNVSILLLIGVVRPAMQPLRGRIQPVT
jgi:uncharacterized membrane protein YtjA (UPF0391 family)